MLRSSKCWKKAKTCTTSPSTHLNFFIILFIFLGLISPFCLQAAVPSRVMTGDEEDLHILGETLKLPLENRIQVLKSKGLVAKQYLKKLIFNRQQNLEVRWRALTTLPYIDQDMGQEVILEALKSEEWYLRNAATISLPVLPRSFAVEWSGRLLSDPALVVRTAAAQNLFRLQAHEKESLLWEKLDSPENFRHGESLWVRRHIVKALAQFAKKGSEAKFIALLHDPDARIHPFAIHALERITGQKMKSKKSPSSSLQEARASWLNWWESQSE